MTDFAKRLRRVRESRGMSPYRLARLTGLSKQGALNLELPGADPKLSTIVKLAGALGVQPWELLPGWGGQSTTVDQEESDEGGAGGDEAARAEARRDRMARREARHRRADARWLRDL